MVSKIIYILTVLVVIYNIFFENYDEKQAKIKQVSCYLSLTVPDNTEVVKFIADNKGQFIVWSLLESTKKDVDSKIKKLEASGWKLVSTEENHKRIYYTFKKNDIIYGIGNYKNGNMWKEDVFIENKN